MGTTPAHRRRVGAPLRSASRWVRAAPRATSGPDDPAHPTGTTRRSHHSPQPGPWHLGGSGA